MQINEVMTKDLITIDSGTSCQQAAQTMKKFNIGALLIVNDNKLTGILTDRDIVIRTTSEDLKPSECTVKDYMSVSPVYVEPQTDIHEAANIMAENQIRRLPVISDNILVGFVSLGDLAVQSENEAERVLENVSKPIRKDVAA